MNISTWIPEAEACSILGYKSAERFRINCKKGILPISFRCTNKRKYQYSINDIMRFQQATSFNNSKVKV